MAASPKIQGTCYFWAVLSSRQYVRNVEGINFDQKTDVKLQMDCEIFSHAEYACMCATWRDLIHFPRGGKLKNEI